MKYISQLNDVRFGIKNCFWKMNFWFFGFFRLNALFNELIWAFLSFFYISIFFLNFTIIWNKCIFGLFFHHNNQISHHQYSKYLYHNFEFFNYDTSCLSSYLLGDISFNVCFDFSRNAYKNNNTSIWIYWMEFYRISLWDVVFVKIVLFESFFPNSSLYSLIYET